MLEIVSQFDVASFHWFNGWAFWRPWIDAVIVFSAVFLGWWMLTGLVAFGLFTLSPLSTVFPSFRPFRKRNWEMIGVALIAAGIARFGVAELIRFFYDQMRPFEVLSDVHQLLFRDGGGSFPSGHATFYFAVAAVVWRYYPKTSILFFLAALNLSLARVQAGVHWPSDIAGGAIVGLGIGFLTHWLAGKYFKSKPAPYFASPPNRPGENQGV
ncbi:MAG: phosphatase PAP2 family protein [Candidatus Sungbacteria bacterium]|uniref:Phosphatase PAP2 family protein n=1 Tax=Candidatus Sungiibacteriota bacterium TaxID=2750080 RepID=A0A932YYQ2_9BACT|nr:phosphatase PAP2 family protein [Candidatus Sungbacteria bacterium]